MTKLNPLRRFLHYYSQIFIGILLISGFFVGVYKDNLPILLAVFLVFLYFPSLKLKGFHILKFCLSLYSLVLIFLLSIVNIITAKSPLQIILALTLVPIALYFWLEILDKIHKFYIRQKSQKPQVLKPIDNQNPQVINQITTINNITNLNQSSNPFDISDENRRLFLKLIGTTSIGIVMMSLINPKRSEAAFFGSVPGPGTVSLKNTSGVKINPAEKHPTDGYKISQVDDSTVPAYYGFINKEGAWYIMQEGSDGSYLYSADSSGFTTAWADKENLTYDYFDNVF